MPNVYYDQIFNPKSITSKNLDNMLLSCNLKSTSLLDDINQNITDTKKTEHDRETDLF